MATRPPILPYPPDADPLSGDPTLIRASIDQRMPFRTENAQEADAVLTEEQAKRQEIDAFITLARDRWSAINQHESDIRTKEQDDLAFFASDQWPTEIKAQRTAEKRPCLTINRLPGFVRQITNEMRDGRPGIRVEPVDNFGDKDKAEAIEGVIQHIEANSDADVAYARAADGQVRIGRGYFRVVPEYASDDSFEQELCIKSIRNPFSVYFDHASQELDGSDARYAFIVADLPLTEYDARYGKETRHGLDAWMGGDSGGDDWKPEGKIRIAEYYCFVPTQKTIHLLSNGYILDDETLQNPAVQAELTAIQVPLTPVRSRQVEGHQLTWALINGAEILEGKPDKTAGREMPGRWIPIFPVYGEEIDINGRVEYRGIIRDATGAQQMSNFWKSSMTETVALAPKAPFIAEEGQIEGREGEWDQANVKNFSVLKYKGKAVDGHLLPPPQRNTAEPPIQAMAMLSMQAENDLRATSGFSYDVGAAEKRVEQSGRAILARQKQGETGNSHFSAHLAVALRHAGRVLIDLLPHYYDTPRIKRILGRDGQPKTIVMHAGNPEQAQALAQAQNLAETSIYDLSVGRYDVRVMAGVSYASQRQEDRELMVNALQTNPQLMQLIGDLFFASMDSPIAERIAKRLKKALPPGVQDEDQKPGQVPPEVQQQLQQAGQMIDQLTKTLNDLQDGIETKAMELASRERIAQIQAETQMTIEQAKIASTQALATIQAHTQQQVAAQKVAVDVHKTERQVESAAAQGDAQRGSDHALALLQARMQSIEQMIKIDMARLQVATQASATPPSPASAPPAGAAPALAPPPSPDGSFPAPVSTAPPVPVG